VDWLVALGRPALLAEFERLPELAHDVGVLSAHGIGMLALVQGGPGAPALVLCQERANGAPFDLLARERFGALCAAATPARAIAQRYRRQQDRALDLLSTPAVPDPLRREAAREARARVLPLASRLAVEPADLGLLARVLDLGPWAWSETGRAALSELSGDDATHRCRRLRELVLRAESCASGEPGASEDLLAVLAAAALRFQVLRATGRSAFESWRTAITWIGASAHAVLGDDFPEAVEAVPGGGRSHAASLGWVDAGEPGAPPPPGGAPPEATGWSCPA
jgi:hypothetical protein